MEIIEITNGLIGNLSHNYPNQLRRELGKYVELYRGPEGGTVRSVYDGKAYDWWPTSEPIEGTPWKKIKIVPAR